MKNSLKLLILFFLLLTKPSHSQEKGIVSGKILIGEVQFEIPKEVASNLIYKIDSPEFTIFKKYFDEYKGTLIIITDEDNKIVAALLPVNFRVSRIRCFSVGWWNPDGGTGWGGFWDCLVNG